jgi:hypothetical protein
MLCQKLREVFSCALAIVLVAPAMPADTDARGGGMLAARGSVTLNGYQVSAPSAVLGGEKVVTGGNSLAHITSKGSLALVGPQTRAIYLFRSIKLDSGSVTVSTRAGMSVLAASLVVTPASKPDSNTSYEVSDADGIVTITAEKGDVNLSNGTTVFENSSITLTPAEQNPQDAASQGPGEQGSSATGRGISSRPPPSGATINHPPCTKRFKDRDVNVCVLALIIGGVAFLAYELAFKCDNTTAVKKSPHQVATTCTHVI